VLLDFICSSVKLTNNTMSSTSSTASVGQNFIFVCSCHIHVVKLPKCSITSVIPVPHSATYILGFVLHPETAFYFRVLPGLPSTPRDSLTYAPIRQYHSRTLIRPSFDTEAFSFSSALQRSFYVPPDTRGPTATCCRLRVHEAYPLARLHLTPVR